MDEVPHAFVVPHVTTWRDKQRLAWRDRIEANTAFGRVDTCSIRIAAFVDTSSSQQPLVRRRVEIVQTLLPSAVALDADLHTPKYDLLTTFEVYSKLDDVAIVNGVWSALDAGTRQPNVVEEGA
jgi:hypothetical protein